MTPRIYPDFATAKRAQEKANPRRSHSLPILRIVGPDSREWFVLEREHTRAIGAVAKHIYSFDVKRWDSEEQFLASLSAEELARLRAELLKDRENPS